MNACIVDDGSPLLIQVGGLSGFGCQRTHNALRKHHARRVARAPRPVQSVPCPARPEPGGFPADTVWPDDIQLVSKSPGAEASAWERANDTNVQTRRHTAQLETGPGYRLCGDPPWLMRAGERSVYCSLSKNAARLFAGNGMAAVAHQ
jgi:hypothetical protein